MQNQETSQFYPFAERAGTRLDTYLEILDKPPEITLTPEEKATVLAFENKLTIGENLTGLTEAEIQEEELQVRGIESLWKLWDSESSTTEFYLEYFFTKEGQEDLQKTLGAEIEFQTMDDVRKYFYNFDYSEIEDGTVYTGLAGRSLKYVKKRFAEQLGESNFENVDAVDIPTRIKVVRDSDILAEQIQGYRLLKNYLRDLARELKGKNDNSSIAKMTILDIHRRKVNELIAESFSSAVALLKQNEFDHSPETEAAVSLIRNNLSGLGIFEKDDPTMLRATSRLDRYLYGAGAGKEGEDFIAVSPQAEELADVVSKLSEEQAFTGGYEFEGYEDAVKGKRVDAKNWISWARKVLNKYGLLSQQTEWDPTRKCRPQDNLWQVVENPVGASVSVSYRQGAVKVGHSMDKELAGPSGAASTLSHEICHVIQHENKQKIGLSITVNVGTDRASANFEAGSIVWERMAQENLFGEARPTNPHYLRAAQERLNGKSFKDCAFAFFQSYIQQNPDVEKSKAAKLAFDKTLRLFRKGGILDGESRFLTNSQPLVYLEQELLAQKLKRKNMLHLLMIGGVNIQTLAELHRIGLLDLDRFNLPEQMPHEIVLDEIKKVVQTKTQEI